MILTDDNKLIIRTWGEIYPFELSLGKAVQKEVIDQKEMYKFKTGSIRSELYWNQNCKEFIIFEWRDKHSYPRVLDKDLVMIDISKSSTFQNHDLAIKFRGSYPEVTITPDGKHAVFVFCN